MFLSFATGIFAATYLNNPQFRIAVDKSVKGLMQKGITALNNAGNYDGGRPDERADDIADE